MCGVCVFSVYLHLERAHPFRYSGFLHRHEDMHVRLIGDSSVGVNDCLSVLALRQTGDLFTLCLPFLSPCKIYDRLQRPLDCKVDK